MSDECQFACECHIFNRFRHDGVREFWIRSYCRNRAGSQCARKMLRDAGKRPEEIPITLLPNGLHLADLQSFDGKWEERTAEACRYIEACTPMFDAFVETETRDFWVRRFCFVAKGIRCERRKSIDSGTAPKDVPRRLLPSGDLN